MSIILNYLQCLQSMVEWLNFTDAVILMYILHFPSKRWDNEQTTRFNCIQAVVLDRSWNSSYSLINTRLNNMNQLTVMNRSEPNLALYSSLLFTSVAWNVCALNPYRFCNQQRQVNYTYCQSKKLLQMRRTLKYTILNILLHIANMKDIHRTNILLKHKPYIKVHRKQRKFELTFAKIKLRMYISSTVGSKTRSIIRPQIIGNRISILDWHTILYIKQILKFSKLADLKG